MNYSYTENFETSAYTLSIKTDNDILGIIKSDDFEIAISDEYNDTNITINKNNFQLFGITDKNSDLNKRVDNSLIQNNGILIYSDSFNILNIKLLITCTNGQKTIGFNNSRISLWLDDKTHLITYAALLPKLLRDNKILQYNIDDEDPVLPKSNLRPEFIYDLPVPQQSDIINTINYNYECGDNSGIYVNTDTSVPLYYNTVSAFTGLKGTRSYIDLSSVSSYLVDDLNGNIINLPFKMDGPFNIDLNIHNNFYTKLQYYTYTQYLSADGSELFKNNIHLTFSTTQDQN